MRTTAELDGQLHVELRRLRRVVPEIRSCLVASVDGLLIAADAGELRDDVVDGLAALSAVCLGVSQRVADAVRHDEFQEVVINSLGGYVAMYMVDADAVLMLLTSAGANVGRLNHEARRAVPTISRILQVAAARSGERLPPFVESVPLVPAELPQRDPMPRHRH